MKTYVKEVACKDVDWIKVAEVRVLGLTIVNAAFRRRELSEAENCFTSCNLRVLKYTTFKGLFISIINLVVKALWYKPEGRGFDTR
jgi:hypothetical protein